MRNIPYFWRGNVAGGRKRPPYPTHQLTTGKMSEPSKKVTIKDVAQMAGVSKGTVDRVIHNRGEVSADSLQRVLDVIRRIDYRPNVYASLLASRRHYRIVCLMPHSDPGGFWEIARRGVTRASGECRDFNIEIEVVNYNQFEVESFREACRQTLADLPDAVMIVPMFRSQAAEFVGRLASRKVPFVFIESKLDDTPYMAYYGMPLFESGYLGASLLLRNARPGEVACFRFHRSGDALSNTASVRQEGFEKYLGEKLPGCRLFVDYLYPRVCDENTQVLDRFFAAHPAVRHIIIFNSRSFIAAEYLKARGMEGYTLLGFDPLERNVACMKEGRLDYLIAQKCGTQAYRGVMALRNLFVFKTQPARRDNYMSMDILTALNVDYYVDLPDE